MTFFKAVIATAVLASTSFAQLHLVRGDVDSVQNSNTFVLECTNVQLVSSTVNLRAMHDQSRQNDIYWEMRQDFDNVGIVIQSCLRRSAQDIADLPRLERLGQRDLRDLERLALLDENRRLCRAS